MVANGVPEIHQSLATAPLDVKEAIDWLIRIGGKDVNDSKKDNTGELLNAGKSAFQREIMTGAEGAVESIGDMEAALKSIANELANFIGYESKKGAGGRYHVNGSGIGRRSGQYILKDISTGGFLICCKDDFSECELSCICCQGGKAGGSRCSPRSCPIKALLDCVIVQSVICGSGYPFPTTYGAESEMCCILSFLVTCFVDDEELNNSSLKCRRCGQSTLHEDCHDGCMCIHKKAISKVACRINCLIQLGTTLNTLYSNKNVSMCQICRNCTLCNPPNQSNGCRPCTKCHDGIHCDDCIKGECCQESRSRNGTCQKQCQKCRTCAPVRRAVAFWDAHDNLLYRCMACTQCTGRTSEEGSEACQTCSACSRNPCSEGCKKRILFAKLISELIHFMVYNFTYVSHALTWKIASIKEECCQHKDKAIRCDCRQICCKNCKRKDTPCDDCEAYCICCDEHKNGDSCVCANKCSEKLELLLRPALSGYISAYDYNRATWENLCKRDNDKKCSDGCTELCNCGSSPCPEEGCCTHCPKRQCVKIFCVVVPPIYSFFDYMNQQINSELQNPQGLNTSQWANALIDGDTHLGDLFRTCGFQSSRLQPRMGCDLMQNGHDASSVLCEFKDHQPGNIAPLIESLKKADDKLRVAMIMSKLNSGRPTNYVKPTTVREKLLWLYGLPYSDVYEELQQRFKDSMPKGISSLSIMELTLRLTVFPFHILQNSSQCIWEYVTHGFAVPGSKQSLTYNRNLVRLIWDLYDTLYDVTSALTFMNKQCSVSSINSGWEECKFGKHVNLHGGTSESCTCQRGTCSTSCGHCRSVCIACRGDAKCVCCCPHCELRHDSCVCLARFITANGIMTNEAVSSAFLNGRYGPMGFSTESLREVDMTGAQMYDSISGLLTEDYAAFPRLLEYLLIARAGVPENLSDYYSMLLSLGKRLQLESYNNGGGNKALATVFKSSMANTFLGAHEGIMQPVVIALQRFNNQYYSIPGASSIYNKTSVSPACDMRSLEGCYSAAGFVGYMYSLSSGAYQVDSEYPYNNMRESVRLFINWVFCGVCHFYIEMWRLAEEVDALKCCNSSCTCTCNPITSNICVCKSCNCLCQEVSGGCSCGTVIKCENVQPLLYKNGLTFHEPDFWSLPRRKCKDFSDALHGFIGPDSMLCRLIEAIENFLWHIRMPFCIAFLTLWSTAFCFLIYVFIGYLDRLGIRSRWLSQKSFAHPLQIVMNTKVKPMGSGVGVI